VLSALGLAAAAPRRDATGSFEAAQVERLRARARAALGSDPVRERVRYALRYRGQSFELAIDAPPDAGRSQLRAGFEDAHERAYGYRERDAEVELVTVTVSVWGAAPVLAAPAPDSAAVRSGARIWHGGRELEVELISGEPAPGERIEGPAICALADATLLVRPGWGGRVREDGTIELVRG
jgi:N-methylhydantoinase A